MSFVTHSVHDVAAGLGCTVRWLTEQARSGTVPARRIAKQWRFTDRDVEQIMALCANGFTGTSSTLTSPATGLTQRSRIRLRTRNGLLAPDPP